MYPIQSMGIRSKTLALILILAIAVSCAGLSRFMSRASAQSGTNVSGIISQDTTWTKAKSPYNLNGNILVNNSVTLTVDAGTTINLHGYYIQIDGTIQAVGSSTDKIQLKGNSQNLNNNGIHFTLKSESWNSKNNSGSIIENAVLTSIEISIDGTSPKITGNTINGCVNSQISASPIIDSNYFKSSGQTSETAITAGFSSVVTNNIITGSYPIAILSYDSSIVSNNSITGNRQKGINAYGSVLSNNVVTGCSEWGIRASSGSTSGTLIQNNLVNSNYMGIVTTGYNNIILNNTIINNSIGIYAYSQATINYNNIENNSQNQIKLDTTEKYPVNATHNWWGTINQHSINQTIYDNKNDYNLGVVNFVPFLIAPNPESTPNTNVPMTAPIPSVSQTASATPAIPELSWLVIAPLLLSVISVAVILRHRKNR